LSDQAALTSAESNLLSAKAAYEKATVEMDRATGLLLEHSGIVMADAESGEVRHMPDVPFLAPRQDTPPASPRPQGALRPGSQGGNPEGVRPTQPSGY
jgi:hypothetical protein